MKRIVMARRGVQQWSSGLGECIEAQAICMQTQDFERAYHAFAAKRKPVFEGN
jgi:hypothetical protein